MSMFSRDSHKTAQLLERYYAGDLAADERQELAAALGRTPESLDTHPVLHELNYAVTDAALHNQPSDVESAYDRLMARIDRDERLASAAALGTQQENDEKQQFGTIVPLDDSDAPAGVDEIDERARKSRNDLIRRFPLRPSFLTNFLTHRAATAVFTGLALTTTGIAAVKYYATTGLFGTAVTYVTHNAQRREIDLSDGTHVSLNVASQLSVPTGFNSDHRIVRLQGEALFNVAHATGKPFTVEAARTATRALGTEFSVRAYDSSDVRVAVRSGRVAFDRTVLAHNDVARLKQRTLVVEQQRTVEPMLAFAKGKLVLDGTPLSEAIPQLNRWYGTNLELADHALADVRISMICPEDTVPGVVSLLTGKATLSDSASQQRHLALLIAAVNETNARFRAMTLGTPLPQRRMTLTPEEAQQLLQGASQREQVTTPAHLPKAATPDTGADW